MSRIPMVTLISLLLTAACSTTSTTEYPARVSEQDVDGSAEDLGLAPGSYDYRPRGTKFPDPDGHTTYRPDGAYQTHGGVTVRVTEVSYSSREMIMDLVVLAERQYGFLWDEELLPQYAYVLNDFQLVDDQGREVRSISGEYGFARSDPSGRVAFDHHYLFEVPAADAKELTLQLSSVVLGNLYAGTVTEFSFEGLTIGDEWELHQPVIFGPLSVVLDRARLREATGQLHSFRLEADYSHSPSEFMGTSIHPTCLRMYPWFNPSFSSLQDSGCVDSAATSYIEFGSAKMLNPSLPKQPLQVRAITDLVVGGPWIMSWSIEN